MTIITQNRTVMVPKFTFQLHLQVQVLFNLYILVQTDQIHIRVSGLIKLKAAKTRIQEMTKAEKGPRKQAAKYDSFEPEEERYLENNFHAIDTSWLTNILLFFSALKIDKFKIWRRQILSRFLVEPNKYCQSSASGPIHAPDWVINS